MIGIAGHKTTIAEAFCKLLPRDEEVVRERLADMPLDLDRYLICAGYLAGKRIDEIWAAEADKTWQANFVQPASFMECLFRANPNARVCVIGSESGFAGSYDMAYAGAKAALHLYVETKRLDHPGQQLICLAPTVIEDSGMTQRRQDLAACKARGAATRHGRWLSASEVAVQAYQALYVASPFLSKTIIRMAG